MSGAFDFWLVGDTAAGLEMIDCGAADGHTDYCYTERLQVYQEK